MKRPTSIRTSAALGSVGEHLATWRRLRGLTAAEVSTRANISPATLSRLENGGGATLTTVLDVARALGVLEDLVDALDPYSSDVGRARADEHLPKRVRR